MRRWTYTAGSSGLALVIGVGATLAVIEVGHQHAQAPVGARPIAGSVVPHAHLVPVVRPAGHASASPGAEQPVLAADLQTPPPAAASPSVSASRPATQRSGQPHQSATPTTAAPSPTITPPSPAPTPSPRPSPSPSQTSPATPPSPASTCLVSVSALGISVCAKIGG